jgi:hypothetical protein
MRNACRTYAATSSHPLESVNAKLLGVDLAGNRSVGFSVAFQAFILAEITDG